MSNFHCPTGKHCHGPVEVIAAAPHLCVCVDNSDGSGSGFCLLKVKWQILSQ